MAQTCLNLNGFGPKFHCFVTVSVLLFQGIAAGGPTFYSACVTPLRAEAWVADCGEYLAVRTQLAQCQCYLCQG